MVAVKNDNNSGSGFSATKDVANAALSSGAQIVVLNNAAHAIANQAPFPPIPDVPGLDKINDHLTAAQGHANDWLNTYSAEVLNTLQGVVTFGELFTNLYTPLLTAAQNLGTQTSFNQDQISSLISEIGALQTQVNTELTQVQKVQTDLSTYVTNVGSDYSSFKGDYDTANTYLGGDQGKLADLQKEIDADNSAMTKDALMIAGGSVGMVAGILLVVAGALGEFETAGASTALIVGGLALMAGGATATGLGGKDYDAKLEDLTAATIKLNQDQSDLTTLASLKTSFSSIKDQLQSTEDALQSLVTSWQELSNGISAVVSDLQNPEAYLESLQKNDPNATPATVSIIVSAELETANDDWSNSLKQAQTLLANLRGVQFLVIQGQPTQANIQAAYQAQLAA